MACLGLIRESLRDIAVTPDNELTHRCCSQLFKWQSGGHSAETQVILCCIFFFFCSESGVCGCVQCNSVKWMPCVRVCVCVYACLCLQVCACVHSYFPRPTELLMSLPVGVRCFSLCVFLYVCMSVDVSTLAHKQKTLALLFSGFLQLIPHIPSIK